MTPGELARLHARCFTTPAPWSAADFAGFLADPLCFLICAPQGFALGRAVAGEAELLTIAVDPDARRQGTGRALLDALLAAAQTRGAEMLFLEVSAENPAAIALYRAAGLRETGRRRGYYRTPQGQRIDALVMATALPVAQPAAEG